MFYNKYLMLVYIYAYHFIELVKLFSMFIRYNLGEIIILYSPFTLYAINLLKI